MVAASRQQAQGPEEAQWQRQEAASRRRRRQQEQRPKTYAEAAAANAQPKPPAPPPSAAEQPTTTRSSRTSPSIRALARSSVKTQQQPSHRELRPQQPRMPGRQQAKSSLTASANVTDRSADGNVRGNKQQQATSKPVQQAGEQWPRPGQHTTLVGCS